LALTVEQLAKHIGGTLVGGDPNTLILKPASIDTAEAGDVTFLSNMKYAPLLNTTKAGVCIVSDTNDLTANCALIKVKNPDLGFTLAVSALVPLPPRPDSGIHSTAVIHPSAKLGEGVTVGALSVIEANAVIGKNTVIHSNVTVGNGAVVGESCLLYPGVVLYHQIRLGNRVIIHSNAVIGSDGFGYVFDGRDHIKIPQVGTVEIGDDVEIGAGTTIDRARFGKTQIGGGTKIDNVVQVGHNVTIGSKSIIVAQVGIAGSTHIGSGVVVAGQAGISGHIKIGDGAKVVGRAGVSKNIPAGESWGGEPAKPYADFIDELRNIKSIGGLRKRIKELEAIVDELRKSK